MGVFSRTPMFRKLLSLSVRFIFGLFFFKAVFSSNLEAVSSPHSLNESLYLLDRCASLYFEHLKDPSFDKDAWNKLIQATRKGLEEGFPAADDKSEFTRDVINAMFDRSTSFRPTFMIPDDQEFSIVQQLFQQATKDNLPYKICHGNVFFIRKGKSWFVREVMDDASNLLNSGKNSQSLLRGDELLSINGAVFSPSLLCKNGVKTPALLTFKRFPFEKERSISLKLKEETVKDFLLNGVRKSRWVLKRGDQKIGYLRFYVLSEGQMLSVYKNALIQFSKEKVENLILDLRGESFNSSDYPKFLEPLLGTNDPKPRALNYVGKIVILVNKQTNGSKEWMTYLLKEQGRALVVGTKTAGSGAPAKLFVISQEKNNQKMNYIFYVPGADIKRDEWLKKSAFEGVGILPDKEVEDTLLYAAGTDKVLEEALMMFSAKK